jgi:FMN hydrolase / 5-amino-6-(5-phospho-D-ribitylamino)uracil phosphatase
VIRAISFDADQTLWDFRGVMERALTRTTDEITRRFPGVAITPEELQEVRQAVAVGYRGRPHSLEVIRQESFEVALVARGVSAPEASAAAAELVDRYMQLRFEEIHLYDDVRPALDDLSHRFHLALISNGNTDPERCGLPGVFQAVVLGPDHGFEKPDPRAFETAATTLGVATTEMIHVGDDLDDVVGANGVGAVSVLLDRGEVEVDPDLREGAGFAIRTLAELHAVIDSLG